MKPKPEPKSSAPAYEGGDVARAFSLLADMTWSFAASRDLEPTLARAITMIADHVGAEVGSLWLSTEDGADLICSASVGPNPITGRRLPVTQGIVGRSVRENVCQTVLDVSLDPNFSSAMDERSGFVTKSILCAPMSFGEKPIGAIQLANKRGANAHFEAEDILPLQVLASSAALAVVNARMAASLVEHERVRRELELAAEIQRNLLPTAQPQPFPIYGVSIPAREVSGDFFDILPLGDGRIGFCLGDVSGKGMNAALLMAKTASLYRCLAKTNDRPGRLLCALNDEIAETSTRGMFVTMTVGVLDPASGQVCLSNAGHEPTVVRTPKGEFHEIPAEAPPLGIAAGIVPGDSFPESEVGLSGGALYVFSDGLTEASTESGQQLGQAGFQRLADRFAEKPLGERVDAIVAEVCLLETRDDLTLLAVSGAEDGG